MTERTAAEALENYKSVMGCELGTTFHHLLQETWHLCLAWDQYETLFENKERVQLLNSSAARFFRNVQDIFFNHVLLGICRLTDPVKSAGKENLTIKSLPFLVRSDLKDELSNAVQRASDSADFCRDWRNRFIAHNDMGRYTKVSPPLQPATRLGVTAALVAIHETLRIISLAYRDSDLALIEIGDDAAYSLLHTLRHGRSFYDQQKERISRGDIRESDYSFPDWLKPQNVNTRYASKAKR